MIELIKLTKKFGGFTAVNEVTLKIEKGEVFGLLGPNGAGKSTLVSMLSTVVRPTSGEIRINDKPLEQSMGEVKSIIGIVPQELALYETMTPKDNLRFFGSLYGLKGKKLKNRVDEVLEIIELKDKESQIVNEFSGGMKRRVNLGIALLHRPRVLILDEPTVGIDPQSRNHILETIKILNKEEKTTIIYTSHYMEEVEALCSRVGIIDFGKLIELGTREELKERVNLHDILTITYNQIGSNSIDKIKRIPGVEKVSVTNGSIRLFVSPNSNVISILEEMKSAGINMKSFQSEEANLENIFLKLTGKSLRD